MGMLIGLLCRYGLPQVASISSRQGCIFLFPNAAERSELNSGYINKVVEGYISLIIEVVINEEKKTADIQ